MKNYTLLVILLIVTASSCSKQNTEPITVIKDCTGSYLRFNGKDYQVCNQESLKDYKSGTQIETSFEQIESCSNNEIVCLMYHINEGCVNVLKIE